MKTKTRIRLLAKNYAKAIATQNILNAKAFDEICAEMEKLLSEDTIAYDELLPEVRDLLA